jgi:hypothetical protein
MGGWEENGRTDDGMMGGWEDERMRGGRRMAGG